MDNSDNNLVIPFKQSSKNSHVNIFLCGYINMGKIESISIPLQKFKITLCNFNTSNPNKLTASVKSNNALVNNKTAVVTHGNYMPFINMFKVLYDNKEMTIDKLYLMEKKTVPKPVKIIMLQ